MPQMMPIIDHSQWAGINRTVLAAWSNTERGGKALLFAVPFFGLPLLATAYWAIPQTHVPAYIVAAVFAGAMLYLLNGLKRLKERNVLWLRAIVLKKKETRVSHPESPDRDSVSYHLTLKAAEALALSRSGLMAREAIPDDGVFSTTEGVFKHLAAGDEIWAAVMPHDNSVYFMVDATGTLHPG